MLLVGAFDDVMHAHAALRPRALERLGCRVSTFNLVGTGGLLNRLRRVGLARPAGVARSGRPIPRSSWCWRGASCRRRWWRSSSGRAARSGSTGSATSGGPTPPSRRSPRRTTSSSWRAARSRKTVETIGLPPMRYLPPGCDPSVHRPMRSRDQFRANVVFAGTATPHRERLLSELVEFGLAVWGPGLAEDQAAGLLPGRAARPRRLHPRLRRRVGGGQRAVLRGERRRRTRAATAGCSSWPRSACPRWWKTAPTSTAISARARRSWSRARPADFKGLLAEALQDRAWSEQVAAGARQRALSGAHLHAPPRRAAAGRGGRGSRRSRCRRSHSWSPAEPVLRVTRAAFPAAAPPSPDTPGTSAGTPPPSRDG